MMYFLKVLTKMDTQICVYPLLVNECIFLPVIYFHCYIHVNDSSLPMDACFLMAFDPVK